jgi:phosphatidylglycerophosphate synthase
MTPGPTAPERLSETIARLRSHGKPMSGAPAYSRFVNRPLGRIVAAVAYRLGMTPDQVTLVSGLLSFAGILTIALAPVGAATAATVTVLLALGYAFDSADGQLARLRGGGSAPGEWLDHVIDCAKISLLHVAVFVGLVRADVVGEWSTTALGFLVVANLYFFTFVLTDLLRRLASARDRERHSARPPAPASVARSLLVAPTDYGVLCLSFLLWGWQPGFLVVYGLLALATAGYLVLGLPRWRRSLTSSSSG